MHDPYAPPRSTLAPATTNGPSPLLRRWFYRSFWLCCGFGAFAALLLADRQNPVAFAPTFAALVASMLLHLYCLGLAAARLGRQPLPWVGGALLFAPLGTLIAFARMSALLRREGTSAVK
jgi:hypothetical protein